MHSIKKEFRFEAAHRLPSHPGLCSNLHGHSYRVVVHIAGQLQPDGMVLDFGALSEAMRPVLEALDHTTILAKLDPLAAVLSALNYRLLLLDDEPTAEVLCLYVFNALTPRLPTMVKIIRVDVWETEKAMASLEV